VVLIIVMLIMVMLVVCDYEDDRLNQNTAYIIKIYEIIYFKTHRMKGYHSIKPTRLFKYHMFT